jgi:hypothetical protein
MPSKWQIAAVIAESFAGLGAIAAVLIALITLWRQEDDKRREQASRITVTVSHNTEADADRMLWRLHNWSDLPIYDIVFDHMRPILQPDHQYSRNGLKILANDALASVDPGDVLECGFEFVDARDEVNMVTFTDAAGHRWRRAKGELQKVRSHLRW